MKFHMRYRMLMLVTLSILFFICSETYAVQTEFSSSLNPVGSGARATGMGGAFIGVADDATAASWNPAGLIQLEKPEISVVYSYFQRKQAYSSDSHPEMDSGQNMDADGLNYASAAYPFVLLNRNMIVSLNYQRLYDMNKEYRFDFITESTGSSLPILSESGIEDFRQDGFLYTLSPAMAVQVTPDFYIGATYNLWDNFFGKNGWEIHSKQLQDKTRLLEISIGPPVNFYQAFEIRTEQLVTKESDFSFKGRNMHFGLLWALFDSITLGGVYKTAFDADVEEKRTTTTTFTVTQETAGQPPNITSTGPVRESETIDYEYRMPASYGLGLSYRHSDTLTFACDVYRTEWSDFVLTDSEGNEINPLTATDISEGRLKDTTQVRLGMEYLYITGRNVIPVRFGLFYDPEPATGHVDDFYGASFGTGFARGRFVLDISYQYRMGRDVTTDFPAASDSDPDIDQHTVMASAIFYLQ